MIAAAAVVGIAMLAALGHFALLSIGSGLPAVLVVLLLPAWLLLAPLLPRAHRGLVAPEAQREVAARLGEAFKPLHRHKAVGGLQFGQQGRRNVEVIRRGPFVRLDLEDDRDHGATCRGWWTVPATSSSQVRSSRRMKRCACAISKLARPSASLRSTAR